MEVRPSSTEEATQVSTHRDLAGWCEHRPDGDYSVVVTIHGPAFYVKNLVELGASMARAAIQQEEQA